MRSEGGELEERKLIAVSLPASYLISQPVNKGRYDSNKVQVVKQKKEKKKRGCKGQTGLAIR